MDKKSKKELKSKEKAKNVELTDEELREILGGAGEFKFNGPLLSDMPN
jgi:hypothetical protein